MPYICPSNWQVEKQQVIFKDLGKMEYQPAWDYQEELLLKNVTLKREAVSAGKPVTEAGTTNYLLFVEHPPVYTLGKSGKEGINICI